MLLRHKKGSNRTNNNNNDITFTMIHKVLVHLFIQCTHIDTLHHATSASTKHFITADLAWLKLLQ
jgi:hypothetical protein